MNREYIGIGREYADREPERWNHSRNSQNHEIEDDYGVYYEEPYEDQYFYNQRGESASSPGSPDIQNQYQIGMDTSGLTGSMGSLGTSLSNKVYFKSSIKD